MKTEKAKSESKMTEQDHALHHQRVRFDEARAWIVQAAATMRRNADDLEAYTHRISLTERDGGVKPTDVLSWAVNQAMNLYPNLRLDMAVQIATQLTEATAAVNTLKETK